MLKRLVVAVATTFLAFSACAQFQARDINGDGSVDAFFDSAHNLTWLADANYYSTQGNISGINWFGSQMLQGQMTYETALSWVDSLNLYGVDDWRLPVRFLPELTAANQYYCSPTACNGRTPSPSELSFLATALGNTSGPFLNVQTAGWYITAAGFADGATLGMPVAEMRYMGLPGGASYTDETHQLWGFVWAVRDGDIPSGVAAVPEPGTYLLLAAGLIAVAAAARNRRSTGSV